jgi:replicative DNA helicase
MNKAIKSPPYSMEAEQSVLGALLRDNDAVDRLGDLRAEHFYIADHATIFRECMRQIVAGQSCDVVSVMVVLGDSIADAGRYLNEITQSTPSSANIGRYAGIVRDKAIKRGLIVFGRDVAEVAAESTDDSALLLDRASSRLEELSAARVRVEPVRASADLPAHIEVLEQRAAGGVKATSTGYPAVDAKLNGGLRGGELVVLAARPKMGKTSFALNVAANVAEQHSVLVLSMEMPRMQLHDRNIACAGHIPLPHLLQPALMTDQDWTSLSHAAVKIERMNLFLDDQGGLRLLDVRMKAKGIKRRNGLDLLVIDYLQLMEGDGDNRNAQIEGITRGLKALAKELNICIMLLSQLNRRLEERPNKRPTPADLRDSGAIEQDADVVIFLYRDEVYNPDTPDVGVCEVDVALCRQGAPGRVALTYIAEQTRFDSLPRAWAPPARHESRPKRGLASHL